MCSLGADVGAGELLDIILEEVMPQGQCHTTDIGSLERAAEQSHLVQSWQRELHQENREGKCSVFNNAEYTVSRSAFQ